MTDIEIKCKLYHNLKLDGCFILKILAYKEQIKIIKNNLSDNEEKLRIGLFLDSSGGSVEDGFRLSQIIVRLSKMFSLNAENIIVRSNNNNQSLLEVPVWGRNSINPNVDCFNRIALAANNLTQSLKKVSKRDFKQEKIRTKFHIRNFKR